MYYKVTHKDNWISKLK